MILSLRPSLKLLLPDTLSKEDQKEWIEMKIDLLYLKSLSNSLIIVIIFIIIVIGVILRSNEQLLSVIFIIIEKDCYNFRLVIPFVLFCLHRTTVIDCLIFRNIYIKGHSMIIITTIKAPRLSLFYR